MYILLQLKMNKAKQKIAMDMIEEGCHQSMGEELDKQMTKNE